MPESIPNLVLWSDDSILVVNKPPGLLTLPDGYDPDLPHLAAVLEPDYGPLWIVHRLDKETSGVLVMARHAQAHRQLNTQFATRQISKTYHALTAGNPDWEERTVKLSLQPDGDRRHRTVIAPRVGKASVTRLRVLERFGAYALVEAVPETGRTHQIRTHLAAVGYPITGDALYGDGEGVFLSKIKPGYHPGKTPEKAILERLALHARSLSFVHPMSGEEVMFEAPYPEDLENTLRQLRKYSRQT
jgi:RluA family pseudouridine synthase